MEKQSFLSPVMNCLNPFPRDDIYQDICTYGTFYNPAGRHYGMDHANVQCDRCGRTSLDVCIGYGSRDLCLKCVHEVTSRPMIHPRIRWDQMPPIYG